MANVSVIGAGPAGLIFAYALLRSGKGYDVTVYSDRTADDWLNKSAPTGTAALYADVIDIERDLGMDYWTDEMHQMHGVLRDFDL
ncbi:MAG: NAD(P)-binding protein, partial [Pseudomonadota bacterium]